jgi:7-carboxy-7-deazaguanine synthase
VYLTGGEPLLQEDLFSLIRLLLTDDLNVRIATNGTMEVPDWAGYVWWDIDYKCPSSGVDVETFNDHWLKYTGLSDCLKFVILDDKDLEFVDFILKSQNIIESKVQIFVSPALPNNIKFIQKLWNFAIENNIRFSYQIHKLIFGNIRNI